MGQSKEPPPVDQQHKGSIVKARTERSKPQQGKVFHKIKQLRQVIKKARQFEGRKLTRRFKEAEKRASQATASQAINGGKHGGSENRGPSPNENAVGTATPAGRQQEKLKQKILALKTVSMDEVLKKACLLAGLRSAQVEAMVTELANYIAKLLAGGGLQRETREKDVSDAECDDGDIADAGEQKWAVERLLAAKCVEDEILLLKEIVASAKNDEEGMDVGGDGLGRLPENAMDTDGDKEGKDDTMPPAKAAKGRKRLVESDSLSDRGRVDGDDGDDYGGALMGRSELGEEAAERNGEKEVGSESDMEGEMDSEVAGMALEKLLSANRKRRERVLNDNDAEGSEDDGDADTSSGVSVDSDGDESGESEMGVDGESSREDHASESDGDESGSESYGEYDEQSEGEDGDGQSSDDRDEEEVDIRRNVREKRDRGLKRTKGLISASEDEREDDHGARAEMDGPRDKRLGDEGKSRKKTKTVRDVVESGKAEEKGRISQKMADGNEREQRANDSRGRGNGSSAAMRSQKRELKLRKRLLKTTKTGGNRLGQRERRRLAEMILGASARHLASGGPSSAVVPRHPKIDKKRSLGEDNEGDRLSHLRGSGPPKHGRVQAGGGRTPGRVQAGGGRTPGRGQAGGGGRTPGRGRAFDRGEAHSKSQSSAKGAWGRGSATKYNSATASKNADEGRATDGTVDKLHPSWIAKIEQQKKASLLKKAASGKKIKFENSDDDN